MADDDIPISTAAEPAPNLAHKSSANLSPNPSPNLTLEPLPSPSLNPSPNTQPDAAALAFVRQMQAEFTRMRMEHQFAVDEILTKVEILRQEFMHLHQYNPIEHVNARVKTLASMMGKALRRELILSPNAIRDGLTDIAGVRITCSFISDTYRILETLTSQTDVTVVEVRDYIATPKPNGYKSLHAIVQIPVFLSTGPVPVTAELQVRTIAMDFWASLEHKIYYKYDGDVPDHLVASLTAAADVATRLDQHMEQLHSEVRGAGANADAGADAGDGATNRGGGIDDELIRQLLQARQDGRFPGLSE